MVMGRPSIFRHKSHRVKASLTPTGKVLFERARRRLARLTGRQLAAVSDADCFEFCVRGEADTLHYLEAGGVRKHAPVTEPPCE